MRLALNAVLVMGGGASKVGRVSHWTAFVLLQSPQQHGTADGQASPASAQRSCQRPENESPEAAPGPSHSSAAAAVELVHSVKDGFVRLRQLYGV